MQVRIVLIALLVCASLAIAPAFIHAQTTDDIAAKRAALQAQLDTLNTQIAQTQSTLNTLHGEHSSLQRDIDILTAGIKQSQLQVQATQLQIQALSQNITLQNKTITVLSGKIDDQHQALADIIRQTRQLDDASLVEVAFASEDLNTFFGDVDSFASLQEALGASTAKLSDTKDQTETQKEQLTSQETQKEQLKTLEVQEQQKIQSQQKQKQVLLSQTKGQEASYQSTLDVQQKTAAQIRDELFALAGGGGAIPLPTAIADAKIASKITGVRAAMILAILSQESDLGKNTGQCLVTDLTTGDGKGKNTGTPFEGVMKAPRDTTVFKQLMDALGRDWTTTAVSCPQPGGYGGAMGPTQFIPSTWVLYQTRIESALGVATTDPWNALHAITATGLYLEDVGAAGGSSAAESEAAAKYFAGGNWATAGQSYAASVMSKAAQFQEDIDTLGSS